MKENMDYVGRFISTEDGFGIVQTVEKEGVTVDFPDGEQGFYLFGEFSEVDLSASVFSSEEETGVSVEYNGEYGADFYESGEEFEWQDGNGLFSNCSPDIIDAARELAKKLLK